MSHDDPAEVGTFVLPALTSGQGGGRSEDVNSLAPLAAIDALLSEKRRAREALDADIAALERSRELLAGVLLPSRPAESVVAAGSVSPDASSSIAPGAWHETALAVFNDGKMHTTAEVYEAAKAVVGPELGYSAVASWLNRMASGERKVLQKNGRGEFSLPAPRANAEKTAEELTAAV